MKVRYRKRQLLGFIGCPNTNMGKLGCSKCPYSQYVIKQIRK